MPFKEYLQKHICHSLGLTSTTLFIHRRPDIYRHLVDCRTRDAEGKLAPWPFDSKMIVSNFRMDDLIQEQGCNGLHSSAQDFITLLSDLLQEQPTLLKPETAELLFRPARGRLGGSRRTLGCTRRKPTYPGWQYCRDHLLVGDGMFLVYEPS
ncbi:hypothetical protein ASPWEDRAFT_42878 [Aspergillus wentii DTO 134E9]|uniref:Uncharacterized protein n=1 Tax=Aspergillus wentii DTO 134E9 TaxID=1073089 RepID=A0A1L9RDB8_ASPWE|nr:uncharacterized protein ASPWEDRAFT_42878 [Aspergillus wentii DTO 134E9]OJJ32843.1 hypothetical protein ASPWEDRAFT_42878 [Aspergillus wentii DTO 134E9]